MDMYTVELEPDTVNTTSTRDLEKVSSKRIRITTGSPRNCRLSSDGMRAELASAKADANALGFF